MLFKHGSWNRKDVQYIYICKWFNSGLTKETDSQFWIERETNHRQWIAALIIFPWHSMYLHPVIACLYSGYHMIILSTSRSKRLSCRRLYLVHQIKLQDFFRSLLFKMHTCSAPLSHVRRACWFIQCLICKIGCLRARTGWIGQHQGARCWNQTKLKPSSQTEYYLFTAVGNA